MNNQVNPKQNEQSVSTETHGQANRITTSWPIDQVALRQLVGPQAVTQMLDFLPDFFEASTPQVLRLLQAAEQMDGREMYLMAHTLRGSSANMAMTSLVDLCRAIEKACAAGHLPEAVSQVQQFRAEYIRIQHAYDLPSSMDDD